jgi:hypothetical protein
MAWRQVKPSVERSSCKPRRCGPWSDLGSAGIQHGTVAARQRTVWRATSEQKDRRHAACMRAVALTQNASDAGCAGKDNGQAVTRRAVGRRTVMHRLTSSPAEGGRLLRHQARHGATWIASAGIPATGDAAAPLAGRRYRHAPPWMHRPQGTGGMNSKHRALDPMSTDSSRVL